MSDRAKVTVALDVKMVVEVDDEGYLGVNETVQKHIIHAKEEVRQNWQFLVKRGALEPQRVKAEIKVLAVSIVPEGT